MGADVGFVHLHVHSSYSLLEGALTIGRLAELAKADRQPALALTDTDNMFGALEFSDKLAGYGIQPIVGAALAIDFADGALGASTIAGAASGARIATRPAPLPRIVFLAAHPDGYSNLMRLSSRAFLDTPAGEAPHLKLGWLAGATEGLIALTGGPNGPLDTMVAAGQGEAAVARCEILLRLFGDRLYVELQRHGLPEERATEPVLLDLAYGKGIPLVAANEPFFATAGDYEAHDALICIAEGRLVAEGDRRQLTPEHRFKTRGEMAVLFADLPEALASTVEIATRCAFRRRTRKPILPRFSLDTATAQTHESTPASAPAHAPVDEAAELRRQAEQGLAARIANQGLAPGQIEADYRERLAFELGVIEKMKYPGYFLIVADFIKWAKAHGIPVGPGRGSGAGSLTAYALTITDLGPIRFGLLFERFLNPDRVSMPDFDIDFCQDGATRSSATCRSATAAIRSPRSSRSARCGIRRAARRRPRARDAVADRQAVQDGAAEPGNPVSLKRAIEEEPQLQARATRSDRAAPRHRAERGLYRHASTHAAGIVIGDRPLAELVPLYRDRNPTCGHPVQHEMGGARWPGQIRLPWPEDTDRARRRDKLVARRGIELDLLRIPLDDEKTYAMLGRGETCGIFQVESQGMRRALIDMVPDRFEDLIVLVALYRPGPMANIPTYCARKLGREKIEYLHPKLEPILAPTYGIITYQEQVQQIARDLAGYSLAEADLLRRAMGKKIRAEMAAQRGRFLAGAQERGTDAVTAETIFDACAKFAEYGFNKSHSAPYAFITYQTAYMKANYPAEFLAASMTLDMGNTDKLSEFRAEAERLGIAVEPPSVNRSDVAFEVEGDVIHYALAALKGVGREAVKSIVTARDAGGGNGAARGKKPFRDLADFAGRINPRAVNKRVPESLAAAGAFDAIEPDRARAFAACDAMLSEAQRRHEMTTSGAMEFSFGNAAGAGAPLVLPSSQPWPPADRLQKEFEAIGFFLSGHPLDDYAAALKRLRTQPWAEFSRAVRAGATAGKVAAYVVSRIERRTRTGGRMGIVGLSDPSGHFEAVIFAEGLQQYRELLEPGRAVLLFLNAELQGDEVRARIQSAEPLEQAAEKLTQGLRVFMRSEAPLDGVARRLEARGDGEVSVVVMLAGGTEVEVRLPGRFKVSPQIAGAIKAVPGVVAVEAA